MQILAIVFKLVMGWLTGNQKESDRTKAEAFEGRAESVQESYAEQDKAREESDKVAKEVEEQGNEDDLFGSEDWNGDVKNDDEKNENN